MLPKPLCLSNKPSPARLPLVCFVSPPRTCLGSSCRQAPTPRPTPAAWAAVGSPGICSTTLAAHSPSQTLDRVLGCPASPSPWKNHSWWKGSAPRVKVLAAPRGTGYSVGRVEIPYPVGGCPTPSVQIRGAPNSTTMVLVKVLTSPISSSLCPKCCGGPKGALTVTRGQPWGVLWGGEVPNKVWRCWRGTKLSISGPGVQPQRRVQHRAQPPPASASFDKKK